MVIERRFAFYVNKCYNYNIKYKGGILALYTLEKVKSQIRKIGADDFVKLVSQEDFPESIKIDLEKIDVFSGGYPNLSYILTLA